MTDLNSQLPPLSLPQPPRNGFVFYSFSERNTLYIQWDDPNINPFNDTFDLEGVNVYRSYDSELGPYTKLNMDPIAVGFYKDAMTHTEIVEDVSNSFIYRGNSPALEWAFKTKYPVVKNSSDFIYANTASDVEILIDGELAYPAVVDGENGIIKLITDWYLDKLTRRRVEPILPKPNSVVTCKYLHNTNLVNLKNHARVFYKLTTVSSVGETSLNHSPALCQQQIESWDYVWREAVRRNRWILQQAGEDCHVFLRKWFGDRCSCYSTVHKRSETDCMLCWGTGIVGGYVGPFPFKMAPVDSSETRLERVEAGLHPRKSTTSWSNYAPRLNTFDLIFRKNGEIFIVGYVKHTEVRGNSFLQYEFNATLLERSRVEYFIPMNPKIDIPFVTDHPPTPNGQEVRGRTVTFENWTT